jgi:membrane associated rhomboid family serine protease
MLPLRDNIPPHSFPFMNYTMIGICTVAFLVQLTEPPDQSTIVEKYGMIPARVSNPGATIEIKHQEIVETDRGPAKVEKTKIAAAAPIPAWLTMLTCVFLHGGWMHFLGNMWFLHIFGDNVEDRFGHFGYALFYLAAGAAASLSHFVDPHSTIPQSGERSDRRRDRGLHVAVPHAG